MRSLKIKLLITAAIPLTVVTGLAFAGERPKPSSSMNVASMQLAQNPCAAKNPCAPKNPCAANPCAANPCAANPCAAAGAATNCFVPRLRAATANPCAAKNPCAANPCRPNPCAAKNPCAANPCAANPCAAAAEVKLSKEEAITAYNCAKKAMQDGYAKSGDKTAKSYGTWTNYSAQPYPSATHGQRFVNNYANGIAKNYGRFEQSGKMPVGSILAKDSFTIGAKGQVAAGPLFLMEKMSAGFNKASGDWRYTMVMPTGAVAGTTKGKGSKAVEFCIACHAAVAEAQDHMFFLPEEFRRK